MKLLNIIVAVLVAYVVMDLLLAVMLSKKHASLIEQLIQNLGTESGMLVGVLGVAAGLLTWYLLEKKHVLK
jgi:hypothetical protein